MSMTCEKCGFAFDNDGRGCPKCLMTLCRQMLDGLLELEEGLTDWEMGFVESLDGQFTTRETVFSTRQVEVLTRIYDQRC